jgi:MFS family permease
MGWRVTTSLVPRPQSSTTEQGDRNVYVFGLTSLLNDTSSEMAYWVLPAFLASLGAGPAQLGIIEGIAESVASFAKLLSGYLADRVPRRKPVVVGGYLVANAVKPLLAIATSWWHVLFIRFADRLSKGVRGAPRDVMVSESVETSNIGSAYGLIQAMDSAGAIAGPLIALLLLSHYGLRSVFWTASVPGLLCVLVAWLGVRESRTSQREITTKELTIVPPGPWRLPGGFYYILIAVTLFSIGNSSDMFLVLRAQDFGIPVKEAPLLGLLFNITYTAFSWPAGKLSDRVSRKAVAAAGYLVFAIVYFVFAAPPSAMALWTTMAFYGLFYALTNPVLKALVVEVVAPDMRGRALGVYFFATSVATLLASVITGELWKQYGARVPFYVSAGIAAASAGMLLLAPKPSVPNTAH